ncbi:MAG: T9SS type A sorting domain-containing protein [Flavisolibacter sp.]|nr:T9SS type A sorting domain-containing protein [Flavisolibacter sp.]
MKYFAAFVLLVLLSPGVSFSQSKTIVVIGSSTSFGYGLTNRATESWVNKTKIYYRDKGIMTDNELRNLSQTGTNCVTGMPNGYVSPYTATDFHVPDTARNITAAIKLKPDVIIVSYPTNGYDWMPFNDIINDLAVIKKTAEGAGIRCFITTTQPRNTFGPGERQKLKNLRDTILKKFGNFAIDFWGVLAGPDNGILPQFNLDNVHPNAAGHDELYKQVIAKSLFETAALLPPPNQPPIAKAGVDTAITLPLNSLTLSGSGSDPDGTVVSYLWKAIAGPGQYLIATPSSAQTQVSNLTSGKYGFELAVTDNGGFVAKDTVYVTVNPVVVAPPPPPPPVNQAPKASAGNDITITIPTNSVQLNGSGWDPDGTIQSYLWAKVSGPQQYSIGNTSAAQTTLTNLVQGQYFFEFKVTDNGGLYATDTIVITVNPAAAVPPPPSQATLPPASYNKISLTKQNEKLVLNWKVSNEPKTALYTIEKSKDSLHFLSIGTITGNNSASANSYSFVDEKPWVGYNYYRVIMTAPPNPTLISSVLKLYNSEEAFVITDMHPMPAHDKIQFSIDAGDASTMSLTLFDLGGKQCAFTSQALKTGINIFSYPLGAFSAGIYFMRISNGKKTQLLKIIRSN